MVGFTLASSGSQQRLHFHPTYLHKAKHWRSVVADDAGRTHPFCAFAFLPDVSPSGCEFMYPLNSALVGKTPTRCQLSDMALPVSILNALLLLG